MDLKAHIRQIPDFPKPGILFYDISTLLAHGAAWRETVDRVADAVRAYRPDLLAAIESRGFIFAAPVAYQLGIGFTMVRKVDADVAGAVFLIELMGLRGRSRLDVPMTTLLGYEGG